MYSDKTNKPLFKIDFNAWKLLKNPETGLLIDPVSKNEFDRFEYWKNAFGKPIRQILCKKKASHYADYLNLDTTSLYRSPTSTLGYSAYDDEISKEDYEELCQTALLKHHYNKQINYDILLPFQTLSLYFLRLKENVLILKLNQLYKVNIEKKQLEKAAILSYKTRLKYDKVSEYEFFYSAIQDLIKTGGIEFLSN